MKCKTCGRMNDEEARFCAACGAMLSEESQEDTTIIYSPTEVEIEKKDELVTVSLDELRQDVPVLMVENGPNTGETWRVEAGGVLLGRHPEADIFLSDITVSREHARIIRDDSGYVLEDNSSLNGTYVNRNEIDRVVLHDQDEIQIGKFKMLFLDAR
jgi:RNA polymerase subunit RPABC4/transcription elongation factor Spt4